MRCPEAGGSGSGGSPGGEGRQWCSSSRGRLKEEAGVLAGRLRGLEEKMGGGGRGSGGNRPGDGWQDWVQLTGGYGETEGRVGSGGWRVWGPLSSCPQLTCADLRLEPILQPGDQRGQDVHAQKNHLQWETPGPH